MQKSTKFQSSPGWLAGRCGLWSQMYLLDFGFNPRPAGWPGAALQHLSFFYGQVFQSSPGWLAGRCAQLLATGLQ